MNPTSGILKDSTNLPGVFYVSWLDTSQGSASEMDLKFADWEQTLVYLMCDFMPFGLKLENIK